VRTACVTEQPALDFELTAATRSFDQLSLFVPMCVIDEFVFYGYIYGGRMDVECHNIEQHFYFAVYCV
jgi:hypothetical protein